MAKPTANDNALPRVECSTWVEVETKISELAAESPNLAQKTLENARLFARFAPGLYQTPDEIGLGYWPTICFIWSSTVPPIEIEIFEDHYEFYSFSEGATDIQHVAHTSGNFPEALKLLLDAAVSQTL
ncbi:hypothetical protein [Agrobacterium sp. CG674]